MPRRRLYSPTSSQRPIPSRTQSVVSSFHLPESCIYLPESCTHLSKAGPDKPLQGGESLTDGGGAFFGILLRHAPHFPAPTSSESQDKSPFLLTEAASFFFTV